jgi:diguanylate cyclase (GGDEF)-like protein/PAS domain S-box-containing protein
VAPQLKPHANEPADDARLENSLAALAAHRRDSILEAIAMSAEELLRSSDLDASLPKVVECVGEAAGADRLHILLKGAHHGAGEQGFVGGHYVWNAPGISSPPGFLAIGKTMADVGLASWVHALAAGKTVVGRPRDFDPPARMFMEAAGIKSALAIPIFVEGEWSGIIGFDNCRSEHDWLPAEIDTIKILAELVSAAMVSLRRVAVLADANRIVEASPTVVYRLGPQEPFPLVFVSHNIRRYGYNAADLMAEPNRWPELIEREDLAVAMTNLRAIVAGTRENDRLEFRFRKPDGSRVWFVAETKPLRKADGGLVAIEGILTDITERRRAEQELAASHVLLTAAIENSLDAILVVDQNARITAFNRHFADMWEIPQQLIAARDDAPVLKLVAARMKNEGEFMTRVRALYAQPHVGSHDELETKDGRTIERHSAPLYDGKEQYLGRIWFFRDITTRKTAEQTIIELARTDCLTGLPNRIAFLDRLHLAFARAKRGVTSFAVLYLDLDHFKDVNDTLGHPIGDALLKVVADRLKSCVRETDMVARFGGDEFAVLQEDVTNIVDTEALATKICRTIAAPLSIDSNQIHTSASIGIVPCQGDIADPEAMMTKADLAVYRAKTEGRNRFRFHIRELDEKVRERVMIGEGLHSAIENEELELYYQPQVELKSGLLVGLEALIRWDHPERGLLLPEQFIPIAESNGSILQIGQWVIEQVCRQIAVWQQQDIVPQVVAANISAGQFKLASNLDLVVAAALAKYGIAADQLELELTESVLMEATQRHSEEFERLRRVGVRLAIDDFGTGYSSFDYLRTFRATRNVARLKIDRRFVDSVTTDSDDATIVRAIVGLASALGVEVVAEGVETAEQRDFLISAGCKFAQGYHFGKPVPAAAATAILRRNRQPKANIG